MTATLIREGYKQVSKEEFFGLIYKGNLNVHPYSRSAWSQEHGYLTEWEFPNREVFGLSDEGGGGIPGATAVHRYWVKV